MALLRVRLRAISADIRGGLRTLIGLYVFDAFFLELGGLTCIVGWVMVVRGAIDLAAGTGADRARRGLVTIAAYAALDFAVFGTIWAHDALARHRAEHVIAALVHYKVDSGHYPRSLDELVPQYMPSVPSAKYGLTPAFSSFHYFHVAEKEDAILSYSSQPPFGGWVYCLSTKKWQFLD
jgi:hypothetical protein